jgi:hypothetical protein
VIPTCPSPNDCHTGPGSPKVACYAFSVR